MSLKPLYTEFPARVAWKVASWWYGARLFWYTTDKGVWIFTCAVGVLIATFGLLAHAIFVHQGDRQSLTCLAHNVYFEARGEPIAGQYAVAEVTMNRLASGRYPDTVCGVVYQQNWDPLRKRYVGAFSWTELSTVPTPVGEEWQQAWNVAEAVYYGRQAPTLDGALFYHAAYIKPRWAKGKKPVARIGRHVFYK